MSNPYIALLRAINVGGHTVKMDLLRGLFEQLGFEQVRTFIASGNVIFDAPNQEVAALEPLIEEHLRAALGYEVKTFIRTASEITTIAAHMPYSSETLPSGDYNLYVAFLNAPPGDEAWQRLLTARSPIDDFALTQREIYWLCRTSISQSQFDGARLEKLIGMPATVRNITTVRKLAAKYGGDA